MKKGMTLDQVDQRLATLELILTNRDNEGKLRNPRKKEQSYKTEKSQLIKLRQTLLTPELI